MDRFEAKNAKNERKAKVLGLFSSSLVKIALSESPNSTVLAVME
jgi:hypothetical protein